MLKGLPASGKSTIAETIVKEGGGNWVRVNRDLLRTMLHFDKWSGQNEENTVRAEVAIVRSLLACNVNVVIDDTNLGDKHRDTWSNVAKDFVATFETREIDTDVATCLERDALREKKVGAHVIMNMAMQYNLIKGMKKIIVCDIDGTVADGQHRVHHVSGDKKDWDKYFSLMHLDTPRHDVITDVLADQLETGSHVILVSARPEKYRDVTVEWLQKNGVPHTHLLMRPDGDSREDSIIKKNIYDKYLKHYDIVKVFDDRPRVIRMWQSLGLTVEDVGNGIEF